MKFTRFLLPIALVAMVAVSCTKEDATTEDILNKRAQFDANLSADEQNTIATTRVDQSGENVTAVMDIASEHEAELLALLEGVSLEDLEDCWEEDGDYEDFDDFCGNDSRCDSDEAEEDEPEEDESEEGSTSTETGSTTISQSTAEQVRQYSFLMLQPI